MAGSVTTTRQYLPYYGCEVIIFAWTSAADGTVSGVGGVNGVFGRIASVRFYPGTGVTDAYDVTLLDANGLDVLLGVGANVSNSATNTAANIRTPLNTDKGFVVLNGATLTPAISGAGDSKTGTIELIMGMV